MMVEAMGDFQERFRQHINHLRWIIDVVMAMIDRQYTGSLTIDFHKGNPSKRIRKQTVETIE